MANPRCATCRHFATVPMGESTQTVCEREGAKVFAQAFHLGQGNVVWATVTSWTQVTASNGCAHHVPDILLRN